MENINEKKPDTFVWKNPIKQLFAWFRRQPDKKRLIEFITALLSVPVMITVILINLNNLNQNKSTTKETQITPIQIVITGAIPQNRPDDRPIIINNATTTPGVVTPTLTPTPGPTNTPYILIATPTPTPIIVTATPTPVNTITPNPTP